MNPIMNPPVQFHFATIDDIHVLYRTGMSVDEYNNLIMYANDNDLWVDINDAVICNEQGWVTMLRDVCFMHFINNT
jgi:hypothetical protein